MAELLKTEQDSIEIYRRILFAAAEILGTEVREVGAVFEHHQWWVQDLRTRAMYSVVDAEGGRSIDGFDLEQVSEGDVSR